MKKKIKKLLEYYKEMLSKAPHTLKDVMGGVDSAYDLVYRLFAYGIIELEEFHEIRDMMNRYYEEYLEILKGKKNDR